MSKTGTIEQVLRQLPVVGKNFVYHGDSLYQSRQELVRLITDMSKEIKELKEEVNKLKTFKDSVNCFVGKT